jgi:DNA primase
VIPDSFKQDLLNRVDIVDVVSRYVQLKKGGANYQGLCPFHNEKTPSFTVSPSKQFYHCFGCGEHGNAIGFLMAYGGMGYVDAVKDLAASVGMQVPERPRTREEVEREERATDLYAVMEKAMEFYRAELKKSPRAIEYLKGRGLSGEIAARFRIGYAPDGWQGLQEVFPSYEDKSLVECGLVIENEGKRYDRFRDRVMFPIFSARGAVIGFGGRVIGQGEPKYLNSPETSLFEKGREIYGLGHATEAIRTAGRVIVVEGYMDVVGLAQHGVEYAVATLGTATTPVHIQKLLKRADEIVFCFDGDDAGRKAAWRALEVSLPLATDHQPMRFMFLPQGEDPDTYIRQHGKEAFEARLREAEMLSEYLIGRLRSQSDLRSAEGRAQFVSAAKPHLQKVAAPGLKLQLTKELGRLAGLSQEEAEKLLELPRTTTYARAAPAKTSFRPPSTIEWKLLARVAVYPPLAAEITPDLMAESLAESQALMHIRGAGALSPAMLIEQFKNTPHEELLGQAQAFGELMKEDEDAARQFVRQTLASLDLARRKRELKTYEERLGRGQLSKDEHRRYAAMISEVKALEQRLARSGSAPI